MPRTGPSSDVFTALPAERTIRGLQSAARRPEEEATGGVKGSKRSLAVRDRLNRIGKDHVDAKGTEREVSEDHVGGTRDGTVPTRVGASDPEGAEWMMKIGSGDTRIITLDGIQYVVSVKFAFAVQHLPRMAPTSTFNTIQTCFLAGPSATLLANEILRSHRGPQQRLRRRRVLYAVTVTLAVVGLSCWIIVENVIAVIRRKTLGLGRAVEVVRWIELGVGTGSLVVGIGVFGWLRTRRAHFSTYLLLPLATLSTLSHLLLAFTNLALTQKHRISLSNRCKWGISMTWSSGASSRICPHSEEMAKAWLSAALLRIVITTFIGVLWFVALWAFQRCLKKMVSPLMNGDGIDTTGQRGIEGWRLSNEARALLDQKGASIRLSDKTDQLRNRRRDDRLLHMPEYEPGRFEEAVGEEEEDDDDVIVHSRSQTESSFGIWLGAKLFGWMSWGMGLDSYNESNIKVTNRGDGVDDQEEEKGLVPNEDQLEPNYPGQRVIDD